MAKPTESVDWATNGTSDDILEPTSSQRAVGVVEGGTWTRKRLNWMFNSLGKWINWVKDNVRSNDENDDRYVQHTEVVDNVTTTGTDVPLSANQGKVLNDKFGIGTSQVQTNAQNKTEFVSHSEVVDNLTSTSATNPASANQAKVLKELIDIGSQVGDVKFTAGSAAPTGWIKADGSELSRTTYADLFSVVGITYGGGDGITTFNVPDLRGEFIRGWDDGRGEDAGRDLGSWQADELKSHTHSLNVWSQDNTGDAMEDTNEAGTPRDSYTGATGGNETRPRNVAMLAVIKY